MHEPVEEWLPGKLCTGVDELIEEMAAVFTGNDHYADARRALAMVLNPQKKPNSTERLFRLVGNDLGMFLPPEVPE